MSKLGITSSSKNCCWLHSQPY